MCRSCPCYAAAEKTPPPRRVGWPTSDFKTRASALVTWFGVERPIGQSEHSIFSHIGHPSAALEPTVQASVGGVFATPAVRGVRARHAAAWSAEYRLRTADCRTKDKEWERHTRGSMFGKKRSSRASSAADRNASEPLVPKPGEAGGEETPPVPGQRNSVRRLMREFVRILRRDEYVSRTPFHPGWLWPRPLSTLLAHSVGPCLLVRAERAGQR